MAPTTTLRLTNRSKKQPIRKLPASVDLPAGATVEDVKVLVAKASGIRDHNRVGLFDPSTSKSLKDRLALISQEKGVTAAGEVQVKDLGPQAGWTTCYVIEYLGPILFHVIIVAARPYLYRDADYNLSTAQWLSFGMIVLHFIKREIETVFVHKFSAATMPLSYVFRNSLFYWSLKGLFAAYFMYGPTSLTATADNTALLAVGTALYLFGETGTALVHLYLSSLRSRGGTERQIPRGYGFGLVTCPNYMYEIIAWIGIFMVSRNWVLIISMSIGNYMMYVWGSGKERAYRSQFGDKYKKKRYVMLPGLV